MMNIALLTEDFTAVFSASLSHLSFGLSGAMSLVSERITAFSARPVRSAETPAEQPSYHLH